MGVLANPRAFITPLPLASRWSIPTRLQQLDHRLCPVVHISHRRSITRVAPRLRASPTPDATAYQVIQDAVIQVRSDLPCDKTRFIPVAMKTENLGGRRRRISGSIQIDSSLDRVWRVLTSYHYIDRYMPNIVQCDVVERDGLLFLDQTGIISRKLRLHTRMLMRVDEDIPGCAVTFTRIEGRDFSDFVGIFRVREASSGVRLDYELKAIPFPLFPMYLVERKIVKEVPKMLAAVREESLIGKVIPFEI